MRIVTGTRDAYARLARFHYRGDMPRVISSVLCLVRDAPTVVGRFLHRRDESETLGVLVRAMPALSVRLRDIATHGRYRVGPARGRATLLNREVRTISRVVIDPRWRGLGLAERLVRHTLDHPERDELIYTEALAAMARVHPFFERAGMRRYELDSHARPDDARLLDALDSIGVPPRELVSNALMAARLANLPATSRAFLRRELQRWRSATGGETKTSRSAQKSLQSNPDRMFASNVEHARTRLLARPVYFLFDHRSFSSSHNLIFPEN